jgi:hypothetical protein
VVIPADVALTDGGALSLLWDPVSALLRPA